MRSRRFNVGVGRARDLRSSGEASRQRLRLASAGRMRQCRRVQQAAGPRHTPRAAQARQPPAEPVATAAVAVHRRAAIPHPSRCSAVQRVDHRRRFDPEDLGPMVTPTMAGPALHRPHRVPPQHRPGAQRLLRLDRGCPPDRRGAPGHRDLDDGRQRQPADRAAGSGRYARSGEPAGAPNTPAVPDSCWMRFASGGVPRVYWLTMPTTTRPRHERRRRGDGAGAAHCGGRSDRASRSTTPMSCWAPMPEARRASGRTASTCRPGSQMVANALISPARAGCAPSACRLARRRQTAPEPMALPADYSPGR